MYALEGARPTADDAAGVVGTSSPNPLTPTPPAAAATPVARTPPTPAAASSAAAASPMHSPKVRSTQGQPLATIRTRPNLAGDTSGHSPAAAAAAAAAASGGSRESKESSDAKRKAFLLKKQRLLQSTLRQTLSQAISANEATVSTFHTEDPAFLQQQAFAARQAAAAAAAATPSSAAGSGGAPSPVAGGGGGVSPLTQQSSGSSKQRGSHHFTIGVSPDSGQASSARSQRPSLTPDQPHTTPTRREREDPSTAATASALAEASSSTLPPLAALAFARKFTAPERQTPSSTTGSRMLSRAESLARVGRSPTTGTMHRGIVISPRAKELKFTPDGKLLATPVSGNPNPGGPLTPDSAVSKTSPTSATTSPLPASAPPTTLSPLAAALARKVVLTHNRVASRQELDIGTHVRDGSRELRVNTASPANTPMNSTAPSRAMDEVREAAAAATSAGSGQHTRQNSSLEFEENPLSSFRRKESSPLNGHDHHHHHHHHHHHQPSPNNLGVARGHTRSRSSASPILGVSGVNFQSPANASSPYGSLPDGGPPPVNPVLKKSVSSAAPSSGAPSRPSLMRSQTMRPSDFAAAKAAAVAAALQAVKGMEEEEKENENDDVPFASPGLSAANAMIHFGVATAEEDDDDNNPMSPRSRISRFVDLEGDRRKSERATARIHGYPTVSFADSSDLGGAAGGDDDASTKDGLLTNKSSRRQQSYSSMYHMLQATSCGASSAGGASSAESGVHQRISSRDLHVLINNGESGVPDARPEHDEHHHHHQHHHEHAHQASPPGPGDKSTDGSSPGASDRAPLVPSSPTSGGGSLPKDPFSLGPRPRQPEAHGRFQLWGLGILWFFAIILQTCALWSNDWLEYTDTQLYHSGKDLIQWITCSFAAGIGLVGYTALMFRMHGLVFATNRYKWLATTCLIGQGVLCITATTLFEQDHSDAVRNSRGFLQFGSAYNFCLLSRSYIACCVVLIFWQEVVELRSRYRARKLEKALARLRVLKEKALRETLEAGEAELGSEAPAMKLHTQEVEHTIQCLGLSAASSARLLAAHKADQLPTSAAIATLLFTLYNDKDYLSRGQRRLVWVSNVFFVIIFFGGLFYAELEGWNARAAVDFAIVTLTTIGYGNMAPKTDIGRIFLYIYFPIGFAVVGYTIQTWWKVVLFKLDHRFSYLSAWASRKLQAHKDRAEERKRMASLRQFDLDRRCGITLKVENMEGSSRQDGGESSRDGSGNADETSRGGDEEDETGSVVRASQQRKSVERSRSSRGRGHDDSCTSRSSCSSSSSSSSSSSGSDDDDSSSSVHSSRRSRSRGGGDLDLEVGLQEYDESELGAVEIEPQDSDRLVVRVDTVDTPSNGPVRLFPHVAAIAPPPPPPESPPAIPAPAGDGGAGSDYLAAITAVANGDGSSSPSVQSPPDGATPLVVSDYMAAITAFSNGNGTSSPQPSNSGGSPLSSPNTAAFSPLSPTSSPSPLQAPTPNTVVFSPGALEKATKVPLPLSPLTSPYSSKVGYSSPVDALGSPEADTVAALHEHLPDIQGEEGADDFAAVNPVAELLSPENDSFMPAPVQEDEERRMHIYQTREQAAAAKEARKDRARKIKLLCAIFFALCWMFISSIIFMRLEGWRYLDAIWFCYVTLTTIGYGDLFPSNSDTSAFFIWFIIFGLGSITYILTLLTEMMVENAAQQQLLEQKRKAKVKARKAKQRAIEAAEAEFEAHQLEEERRERRRLIRQPKTIDEEDGEGDSDDNEQREMTRIDMDPPSVVHEDKAEDDGLVWTGTNAEVDARAFGQGEEDEKEANRTEKQDEAAAPAIVVEPPPTLSVAPVPSDSSLFCPTPSGTSTLVTPISPVPMAPPLAPGAVISPKPIIPIHATIRPGQSQALRASVTRGGSSGSLKRDQIQATLQALADKQGAVPKTRTGPVSMTAANAALTAPPSELLDLAADFETQTRSLLEAAKAAVDTVRALPPGAIDPKALEQYTATYAALQKAEEKRKQSFAAAWARTSDAAAKTEKASEDAREKMLAQIKCFRLESFASKRSAALATRRQSSIVLPSRGSLSGASGQGPAGAINLLTGKPSMGGGASSSSSAVHQRMMSSQISDTSSESESEGEDADFDWDRVGASNRRISALIPAAPKMVVPPIAPPLAPAFTPSITRSTSLKVYGSRSGALSSPSSVNSSSNSDVTRATAAAAPTQTTLNPMEHAAAVARALHEKKNNALTAQNPKHVTKLSHGNSASMLGHHASASVGAGPHHLAHYSTGSSLNLPLAGALNALTGPAEKSPRFHIRPWKHKSLPKAVKEDEAVAGASLSAAPTSSHPTAAWTSTLTVPHAPPMGRPTPSSSPAPLSSAPGEASSADAAASGGTPHGSLSHKKPLRERRKSAMVAGSSRGGLAIAPYAKRQDDDADPAASTSSSGGGGKHKAKRRGYDSMQFALDRNYENLSMPGDNGDAHGTIPEEPAAPTANASSATEGTPSDQKPPLAEGSEKSKEHE